jgi:16S rRNA (cytosine1402-N4)-methyltransferase
MDTYHIPVMRKEAVELLNIHENGVYVDATLGGGGHLAEMFKVNPNIQVIAFDRDKEAIDYAQNHLQNFSDRIIFVNKNFSYLSSALALNRYTNIDGILFDLGVSSHQLERGARGFSFEKDAKLDMRMDPQSKNLSAYEVVNFYPERELERVIREYGEERYWKRIANRIVQVRSEHPIQTTGELRSIIESIVPHKLSIKSIARVFQAIRIEVNQELKSLRKALESAVEVLNPGGRIVVISYHSLEDRLVKEFFKYESLKCVCPPKFPKCVCSKKQRVKIITKQVRFPSPEEIKSNPRARTARLRVAERVNL